MNKNFRLKLQLSPAALKKAHLQDKEIKHPHVTLEQLEEFWSVAEAARYFGKHPNTIRNWLKRGLKLSEVKRARKQRRSSR